MIRLNPNNLAVLLVSSIDGEVAPPATGLVHEPEVGEGGGEGGGDVSDGICAEVGEEVVEDWGEEEDPRREEGGGEHVCGGGDGRRSVDGWEGEDGWRIDFSVCHCEEVIEILARHCNSHYYRQAVMEHSGLLFGRRLDRGTRKRE